MTLPPPPYTAFASRRGRPWSSYRRAAALWGTAVEKSTQHCGRLRISRAASEFKYAHAGIKRCFRHRKPLRHMGVSTEIRNVSCSRNTQRTWIDSSRTSFIIVLLSTLESRTWMGCQRARPGRCQSNTNAVLRITRSGEIREGLSCAQSKDRHCSSRNSRVTIHHSTPFQE
jgi:hypothetical protein